MTPPTEEQAIQQLDDAQTDEEALAVEAQMLSDTDKGVEAEDGIS